MAKYPDIYLGGSISLILQNAIQYREVHDIDLIVTKPKNEYDIFDNKLSPINRRYYYNGNIMEIFKNKNANFINFNYKGHIIKLSPINEIAEWKYKFNHILKHKIDLNEINKNNKRITS